jgi:hypothetical protein
MAYDNTQHEQGSMAPHERPAGEEQKNPALHFFLYLVWFLSLGFVASGVGSILFQIINKYFPDVLSGAYNSLVSQPVAVYGVASLLVAVPVYFIIGHFIQSYLRSGAIDEGSRVRKWLTYIVLFIAAGTIIGDLIALLINILNGDIVWRFALKALVVLAIAGAVFGYYLWEIRRTSVLGAGKREHRVIGGIALGLLIIVFGAAFLVVDSPMAARGKKADEQTLLWVEQTDSVVQSFYSRHAALPTTLADIKNDPLSYFVAQGSVTYEKTASTSYKLCADFARTTQGMINPQMDSYGWTWEHPAGRYCFDRTLEQPAVNGKPFTVPVAR